MGESFMTVNVGGQTRGRGAEAVAAGENKEEPSKINPSDYSCEVILEKTTKDKANDRKLPTDAFNIFYVVDGECVCGDCCNESWEAGEEYFMPIDHPATNNTVYNEEISEHVNYDDDHLYCANCSKKIEGAYLETETEEQL